MAFRNQLLLLQVRISLIGANCVKISRALTKDITLPGRRHHQRGEFFSLFLPAGKFPTFCDAQVYSSTEMCARRVRGNPFGRCLYSKRDADSSAQIVVDSSLAGALQHTTDGSFSLFFVSAMWRKKKMKKDFENFTLWGRKLHAYRML